MDHFGFRGWLTRSFPTCLSHDFKRLPCMAACVVPIGGVSDDVAVSPDWSYWDALSFRVSCGSPESSVRFRPMHYIFQPHLQSTPNLHRYLGTTLAYVMEALRPSYIDTNCIVTRSKPGKPRTPPSERLEVCIPLLEVSGFKDNARYLWFLEPETSNIGYLYTPQTPGRGASKSRSTLGFHNLHHRSTTVEARKSEHGRPPTPN